jgi:hypothetical protein
MKNLLQLIRVINSKIHKDAINKAAYEIEESSSSSKKKKELKRVGILDYGTRQPKVYKKRTQIQI